MKSIDDKFTLFMSVCATLCIGTECPWLSIVEVCGISQDFSSSKTAPVCMSQREIFKGIEHQTGSAPLDTESFFLFIWSSAQSTLGAFESTVHSIFTTVFTVPKSFFPICIFISCNSTFQNVFVFFSVLRICCSVLILCLMVASHFFHIWIICGLIRFTSLYAFNFLFFFNISFFLLLEIVQH